MTISPPAARRPAAPVAPEVAAPDPVTPAPDVPDDDGSGPTHPLDAQDGHGGPDEAPVRRRRSLTVRARILVLVAVFAVVGAGLGVRSVGSMQVIAGGTAELARLQAEVAAPLAQARVIQSESAATVARIGAVEPHAAPPLVSRIDALDAQMAEAVSAVEAGGGRGPGRMGHVRVDLRPLARRARRRAAPGGPRR